MTQRQRRPPKSKDPIERWQQCTTCARMVPVRKHPDGFTYTADSDHGPGCTAVRPGRVNAGRLRGQRP